MEKWIRRNELEMFWTTPLLILCYQPLSTKTQITAHVNTYIRNQTTMSWKQTCKKKYKEKWNEIWSLAREFQFPNLMQALKDIEI